MTRKLKVGDHVIVPAAVRGIGEEMKAVVTDVEKGVMGSPNFITCLYVDPAVNSQMKEPLSKKLPCLEDTRSYKNSPLRIIRRTGQNSFIEFGFRCSMMVLGNSVISESNPPQGRVS